MEAIFRRDSASSPVLADLAPPQGCDNELSRSESESEMDSCSTVEDSKARLHQIEDSAKDCLAAWTNEKHNLYLDHLESSFVEQLRQSAGVLPWCSEHDPNGSYLSQKPHPKQFKVVQDGCSENIDVKRNQHYATGSLFALKSHRRCAGKKTKLPFFNEAGMSSEQISAIGEFSDQNFTDEANEQISKRSKTIMPEV